MARTSAKRRGAVCPSRSVPGAVLRRIAVALLTAFLISAALVRVVPVHPALAFLFAGLTAGLMTSVLIEALASSVSAALVTLVLLASASQPGAVGVELVILALLAAAVGAVGGWSAARIVDRTLAQRVLAVFVLTIFLVQAVAVAVPLAREAAVEPPSEQYRFDPVFFLKVFYLQEAGRPFYAAYGEAFAADARFDAPTRDLAGWRSPTVSTLWSLAFSDGGQVVWTFVLLALASMAALYWLAEGLSRTAGALVVPAVLTPYYLFALQRFWFTEYEFWAAFVAVLSAVLYRLRRRWPALGLALLAALMREWLISAPLAGALDALRRRELKKAIPWAATALLVVAFYLVNLTLVRRYLTSVGIEPSLGAQGRLGGGGPGFILYTVKFCADLLAHPYVVSYAVFFLGLIGAGLLAARDEAYLASLLLLPLAAFLVFGSGQGPLGETGWNDYYNAAYWPFAVALTPIALSAIGQDGSWETT